MEKRTLYEQLAEAIGAGESKLIPRIFEALVDEKGAQLLLAAAPPATVEEISEKTGFPAEDVEKMLDLLFKKGLIFMSKKEGPTRYYRVRHVVQFHDATAVSLDASRELLDLWKEYMDAEWGQYSEMMQTALPQPVVRVIPVNVSIDPKTQILAFEDVENIVESARSLAVTRCSCRAIDGKCGKPLEVCLQVNRAADYAVQRGTGRKIDKEEAIEILRRCEQEGLVHVSDNRKAVGHVICNCCEDCCMNWHAMTAGLQRFVAPSRFRAHVDATLCSSCETCMDTCFFDAISMEGENGTALVDPEKCMGCGLCVAACTSDAICLRQVREADFVPE